jgi:hypothetical protein
VQGCPPLGQHGFIKIHTAGGVGGSTTMVVVFVVCLCCVVRLVWSSLTVKKSSIGGKQYLDYL